MAMNMCSNSGGTNACGCCGGAGGGGNGNGGNNNGVSIWNSGSMRKQQQQKRPRIPKRGPGVAELEKILKEQETADVTTTQRGNNEGFSISSSCFIPHPPQSQPTSRPNSNNLHSLIPSSAQKFDLSVSPGVRSMYTNSSTHPLGRNNGVGSMEHEPFRHRNLNEVADGSPSESENSSSSESNHANYSYPATVSRRNNVDPSPKMNEFHGNGGNQNGVLSIGMPNYSVESPSVQNSHYNYSSRSIDEQMMAGRLKRSYSSSLDNSLIPPSNFQVLPSFSRHNRPQQSSTNESHGISSYNPTNECYRDAKWGSTLELSNKIFNSENVGCSHTNFPPFIVPEVPPPRPPMQFFQSDHSKVNNFPCQAAKDKIENSNEEDRKPFFNFLEVKDQEDVTNIINISNNGVLEGGRGGIDLTLKL
ncbi:hypothetical protein RYX36_001132 [Vicia faba]